jgi:hypothetical protein
MQKKSNGNQTDGDDDEDDDDNTDDFCEIPYSQAEDSGESLESIISSF